MNLPPFTAEESLLPTMGIYRTNARADNRRDGGEGKIVLAEIMVGHEVIEVHGCAPGKVLVESGSNWDCWPRSIFDFFFGDDGGTVPPPDPPGGGGGGGGGGSASVPADIVTKCLKVGGRFGEKYCGGIGGPSSCKTCAQIVCQQKECNDSKRCDPNQLNGAKESNCEIGCPDTDVCKNGLTMKYAFVRANPRFVMG